MASAKPILKHQHGSTSGRCGHPECTRATNRYNKRWTYERSQGRVRTVDAGPAKLHVAALVGAGWSIRSIAGEAGVSVTTAYRLTLPETVSVNVSVATKVLAVDGQKIASKPSLGTDQVFVPRIGTVRRIQALLALGWTHPKLKAHSGCSTTMLLSQQGRWVTRSTHDKVAAMYRDLSGRPGPSSRTRDRAARLGYVSPAGWHDVDHDEAPWSDLSDVEDELDDVAIERRLSGDRSAHLTPAEAAAVVHQGIERGLSLKEIERRTGVNAHRHKPTTREDLAS